MWLNVIELEEGAGGLGRYVAQWLLARGQSVVDVHASATARVRQLSRGGGRKSDALDAAAAATVSAAQGGARFRRIVVWQPASTCADLPLDALVYVPAVGLSGGC